MGNLDRLMTMLKERFPDIKVIPDFSDAAGASSFLDAYLGDKWVIFQEHPKHGLGLSNGHHDVAFSNGPEIPVKSVEEALTEAVKILQPA
jgi:hypothetical protein